MAYAADVVCKKSNKELQAAVQELFTTFIKPSTVLYPFKKVLNRPEYESVQKDVTNKGDTFGAHQLLSILTQKDGWFPFLLEVLRHRNVKLQHIANMMEEEIKSPMSASATSISSIYIQHNNELEEIICDIFEYFVKPETVLQVFHKYSNNKVLTKIDIENVLAKVNSLGDKDGAHLLLERLILYENWFDVLLLVLRDQEVNLGHAAKQMEEATFHIRQLYKKEKAKAQQISLDVKIQHHNNKIFTHPSHGTPMQNISNNRYLTANTIEGFESDSAEMRPEIPVVQPSLGKTDNNLTKSKRYISEHTGESPVRNNNSEIKALIAAAVTGDADLLLILLGDTPDKIINATDSNGRTALMNAAHKGKTECVELLITLGCDVNKKDCYGNTALMIACGERRTKCVAVLINGQAEVNVANKVGMTALMVTAKNGYTDCMSLLLDGKCDYNVCNNDGLTSLMYAAHYGHSACVELLIDKKCDVNISDGNGRTALIFAVDNGHSECVKLLIDRCDVNKCDCKGHTPLMYAAKYGHSECVKLLIDRHNINKCDCKGQTALMFAAKHGHTESVKLLTEAGSDIGISDKQGNTALRLAKLCKHKECIELLNKLDNLYIETKRRSDP